MKNKTICLVLNLLIMAHLLLVSCAQKPTE
jgi:hypothetical protein